MANKIESLELENFKSYRGKHQIAFKRNFTSIIGPNGAGKSNLLDAISFVLGVNSNELRGKQLTDLIYKFVEGTTPQKLRCYVKLNFVNEDNKRISFKRMISANSTCTYHFDEKPVTWAVYQKSLHEINLFPKLKNFLVFQGDVATIAQKSGKEITNIIETISGSAELKEEYEDLLAKERTARETTMFLYQKKKGIAAEKKQYKEQTKEAEQFNALTEHIDKLVVKQNLLQLYYIKNEVQELEEKRVSKLEKLKELDTSQVNLLAKLEKEKQDRAKLHQANLKLQKKIRENEKLLEKNRPGVIKAKESVTHFEKRIKEGDAEVKRLQKLFDEQQGKLKQLQKDLKDIEVEETQFEKDVANKEASSVTLSTAQIKAYTTLKEEVGKKTAKQSQELQALDRDYKSKVSQKETLESQQKELLDRIEALSKETELLNTKIEKVSSELVEVTQSKETTTAELQSIQKDNATAKRKQQEIHDKLQSISTQLHEAKSDIEQSENQKKMEQAVESLRRLIPGVFGRIVDLATPKNTKHNLAMAVAIGKHMDSVVVQDERTALHCIQYLKEQRIGVLTFIPLDAKTKPLDERLRGLGKNVHPIIDVLNYDHHLHRAFEFVCGSTLVAETLDQARKLAFDGETRRRVVTVDGSMISKSGLMTGGTAVSGKLAKNAKRWDLKEVSKLKKERDDCNQKLTEIGQQLRSMAQEQQLVVKLSNLETRFKSISFELDLSKEKVTKAQTESDTATKQNAKIKTELTKVNKEINTAQKQIDTLTTAVHQIEDQIFAKFSKEVGIENVREYENARLNKSKEDGEARLRFSTQKSRIQQLIAYEGRRDLDKVLNDQVAKVNKEKENLKKEEASADKIKQTAEVEKKKHQELEKSLESDQNSLTQRDRSIQDLKNQLEVIRKNSAAQLKNSNIVENQMEQLRNKRHGIFRSCMRDEVALPITGGEFPDAVDPESPEEMKQMIKREDLVELDFTTLSEKMLSFNKNQLDTALNAYVEKINSLTTERESIAPNLKAIDRLKDVENRIGNTNTEFEEAKQVARKAVESFQNVKEKRCQRFMKAFDHISKNIDVIYKELTSGNGAAYLTLDNLEEPYLHGVTFNPMPPNKPFGDIENLSGGEKSVAALALLFSIHSYKPAPFFVLDEVDAALDGINVQRVAHYLKRRAETDDMQFLTISLKEKCYSVADALVGVYVERSEESSRTLTLDLVDYPLI